MSESNRGIEVVKLLKQVMDAVKHNISNEFKELELTGPQGMILGILAHTGKMKIGDLSKEMGLTNSTVSGIIDRLEKQGMVERLRSSEDRRVVYVKVTSNFTGKVKGHYKQVDRFFEAMMNRATPGEIEKIIEGLNVLKKLLDRKKKGRCENAENNQVP